MRLNGHLMQILTQGILSPGDASSMRGRLFFYSFWHQEARSYLAEFAARQYSDTADFALTPDLRAAISFFLDLLEHPRFIEGVCPEDFFDRKTSVLYTDGSYEGDDILKPIFKGIGGVLFTSPLDTPQFYEEVIDPTSLNFNHIAVIEMHAILRALQLFRQSLQGTAVILFCDNTHAIGCLLKRSASIKETHQDRNRKKSIHFPSEYDSLPLDIRRCMNYYARRIWALISELECILWIEYVNTKLNIADLPSRQAPLPFRAIDVPSGHVCEESHAARKLLGFTRH